MATAHIEKTATPTKNNNKIEMLWEHNVQRLRRKNVSETFSSHRTRNRVCDFAFCLIPNAMNENKINKKKNEEEEKEKRIHTNAYEMKA